MKVKWILVQNEWFEKKVVNDDLFKRKSVVVNFWCFLQSWCISLEKNLFKLTRIFRDACQSQNIVKRADYNFFFVGEYWKKALCVYCCALLFQQLITSWKCIFALEVQSFLHCIEIDISCSRKCKKIHTQFLIFRSWKKSTWSFVDCGKWASSSRFKIAKFLEQLLWNCN